MTDAAKIARLRAALLELALFGETEDKHCWCPSGWCTSHPEEADERCTRLRALLHNTAPQPAEMHT